MAINVKDKLVTLESLGIAYSAEQDSIQEAEQELSARIDNIITPQGDPSLTEISDARVSGSTTYNTLKARLDADQAAVGTEISAINAVLTPYVQKINDLESRIEELEGDETVGGLSSDVKTALMNLVNHISWDDDTPSGQTYITALYNALYPATESTVELISINAVYTQTGAVYSTDTLDSLKADLTVTGEMSDESTITISDYTLSGTLTEGTSVITVNYDGKTTTFDVIVSTSASPTPTPTPSNAIKISDYYPFVRGFMQLAGNGQVIHQTTYERGCSALLVDVPISAGDTVSLPSYSNLKMSISKTSGEGYVVADISEDYTFSAQDVEDAKSIIIAHIDRTYFEDEDIAWVNENAVIIKAQSGGM